MGVSESTVTVVAYLALFAGVGFAFIFVNLLVGRFLRPADPQPEKLEIYECGEPAIGSSFVQFDLRFYVVALVFIIFDVEVAFLFPWATVFGKAQALMDRRLPVVVETDAGTQLSPQIANLWRELGVIPPVDVSGLSVVQLQEEARHAGRELMQLSVLAIAFFFVVLLIGFAYEWRSGALDWIRAASSQAGPPVTRSAAPQRPSQESVLSV